MLEQWIEEEAMIRLMIDGSAPDGGTFNHLCVTYRPYGARSPHPRILYESPHRFHTKLPSMAQVLAGQSSRRSTQAQLMEAQLEEQGGRAEVAKIEELLRARGFVPVNQQPIWQQMWVRRLRLRE